MDGETQTTTNSRIVELEETIAHQQRLLDELDSVLTRLHSKVDAVEIDNARLKETVKRIVEQLDAAQDRPDERPPHY